MKYYFSLKVCKVIFDEICFFNKFVTLITVFPDSENAQMHLPWELIFMEKVIFDFSISLQLSCIPIEEHKKSQFVFSISLQLN